MLVKGHQCIGSNCVFASSYKFDIRILSILAWFYTAPQYAIREHHALAILLAQWICASISLVLQVHILLAICINDPPPLCLRYNPIDFDTFNICCLLLKYDVTSFTFLVVSLSLRVDLQEGRRPNAWRLSFAARNTVALIRCLWKIALGYVHRWSLMLLVRLRLSIYLFVHYFRIFNLPYDEVIFTKLRNNCPVDGVLARLCRLGWQRHFLSKGTVLRLLTVMLIVLRWQRCDIKMLMIVDIEVKYWLFCAIDRVHLTQNTLRQMSFFRFGWFLS